MRGTHHQSPARGGQWALATAGGVGGLGMVSPGLCLLQGAGLFCRDRSLPSEGGSPFALVFRKPGGVTQCLPGSGMSQITVPRVGKTPQRRQHEAGLAETCGESHPHLSEEELSADGEAEHCLQGCPPVCVRQVGGTTVEEKDPIR